MRQPGAWRTIGIFGGTFDPVHNGHLRTALELVSALGLDELHLVPCSVPATRNAPRASAAERLEMLRLAVAGSSQLLCDEREIRRGGTSYSIDTLRELRAEIGTGDRLCLIVGADAFAALDRWKEWRLLPDYAHIVVLARPGAVPACSAELTAWAAERRAADIEQAFGCAAGGRILELQLTQLAISATRIRELIGAGETPRFLLPDVVLEHIRRHGIYETPI